MKFHMLMLINEWMMLVLMKCKCQMKCLTLGCYRFLIFPILRIALLSISPKPPLEPKSSPYPYLAQEKFWQRLFLYLSLIFRS